MVLSLSNLWIIDDFGGHNGRENRLGLTQGAPINTCPTRPTRLYRSFVGSADVYRSERVRGILNRNQIGYTGRVVGLLVIQTVCGLNQSFLVAVAFNGLEV